MRELGIQSYTHKDRTDKMRPFFILRQFSSFEMFGKFKVGTKRINDGCAAFSKGYAASPHDFNNAADFKEILKKESVNIVAVPGRRDDPTNTENLGTCSKDPGAEQARSLFYIDFPNGESKRADNATFWRDRFPDRTCADSPRIALGFSQAGLVDIPAIARLFTLCTY
ncbi:unnamed protein product, partial [Strongylus vulgaris]